MFTVDIGGKEVKVRFWYVTYGDGGKATHCDVLDGDGDCIGSGLASCSPRDQFNKNTGRKIALSRALDEIFTRDERQLFWDAYFAARNGKY